MITQDQSLTLRKEVRKLDGNKAMKNTSLSTFARFLNGCLCWQLVFGPVVWADDDVTPPGPPPSQNRQRSWNAVADIANALGSATIQGLNLYQQINQQQMAQLQTQQQLAVIQPQPHRDNLFPQCLILPAKTERITGICEDPVSNEFEFAQAMMFKAQAEQNSNMYDNQERLGNLDGKGVGYQCLREQATLLEQSLGDRIKALELLQDKINKADEDFKAQAKKDLDKMQDLNAELNGGDGATQEGDARDYASLFNDPSCSGVIASTDVQDLGRGNGLTAIKDALGSNNSEVQNLLRSESSMRRSIEKMAKEMSEGIRSSTFDDLLVNNNFINSAGPNASRFEGAFNSVASEAYRDVANQMRTLQNTQNKFGGSLNNILSDNIDASVAIEQWETNFYNECMDEKRGISVADFTSKISDPNVSAQSTNTSEFRSRVQTILSDTSTSLSEKRELIRRVENTSYGVNQTFEPGAVIVRGGSTSDRWKVSDYLTLIKNDCERDFRTQKNSAGLTNQDIKQEAQRIRGDYDRLRSGLASDMQLKLESRLLECEGVAYSGAPGNEADSCGPEKINRSSESFCLKQSIACAQNMDQCFKKAERIVKEKQDQRGALAKRYNEQVKQYKVQQRALLEEVKGQFLAQSQALRQFYPGGDFEIPIDLQITVEGEGFNQQFGESLEDTEGYVTALQEKIEDLKQTITAQNNNIMEVVAEKMDRVKSNAREEKGYWDSIVAKCDGLGRSFQQQQQQQQQEMANQAQEEQQLLNDYCFTRNYMSSTAGCGRVEELGSSAQRIIHHLSPGDVQSLNDFEQVCANFNSHNPEEVATYLRSQTDKYCDDYATSACETFNNIVSCLSDIEGIGISDRPDTAEGWREEIAGCENVNLQNVADENLTSRNDVLRTIRQLRDEQRESIVGEMSSNGVLREPGRSVASSDHREEFDRQLREIGEQRHSVCSAQNRGSANPFESLVDGLRDLNNITNPHVITQ